MTPLRWLIVCFWVFVGAMLFKQCHDSDAQRQEQAKKVDAHYFFAPAPTTPTPTPPETKADVQQTAFIVQDDTPGPGNFTCVVTLKNVGSLTAKNIQIQVRPFRGAHTGNDNVGHTPFGILSDNDPLAQMSVSLAFSDLAPGQQATQSTVFSSHANVAPGKNPKPEITFDSVKSNP
jgi:hypothetical protein